MRITITEILILMLVASTIGYFVNLWAYLGVFQLWGLYRAIRYKLRHRRLMKRIIGV